MISMKKTCLLTIVISVLSFIAHAQTLKSPDGRFQLNVSVDQQGRPVYELSFDGKPVILRSGLGLELKKEVEGKQETFDNTKHTDASTIDEKADLMYGFQIKSTKRLIKKKNFWFINNSPCYCNSLLLTTR